jgi:hypothetical protein
MGGTAERAKQNKELSYKKKRVFCQSPKIMLPIESLTAIKKFQ